MNILHFKNQKYKSKIDEFFGRKIKHIFIYIFDRYRVINVVASSIWLCVKNPDPLKF